MYYQMKFKTIFDNSDEVFTGLYNEETEEIICDCCGGTFDLKDKEATLIEHIPYITLGCKVKKG